VALASTYTGLDIAVLTFIRQIRTPVVIDVFRFVDSFSRDALIDVAAVAIAAVAMVTVRGAILVASGAGASVLALLLKPLVGRAPPMAELTAHTASTPMASYPSGHAVLATWLLVLCAYAVATRLPPGARAIPWAMAAAGILLVGFARIWSLAHWPTDVAGGIVLGLIWSLCVIWSAKTIGLIPTPR
jgi:membrane-associated phospholipid phosphatase